MQQVEIIGLGYVGLPLAVAFAEAGLEVIGVDTDPKKLTELRSGSSYVGCTVASLRFTRSRLPRARS